MKKVLIFILTSLSLISFSQMENRQDIGESENQVFIELNTDTKEYLISGAGKISSEKFKNYKKTVIINTNTNEYTIRIDSNTVKLADNATNLFAMVNKNGNLVRGDYNVVFPEDFDTSNVTNMNGLFRQLNNANPNVANWDTSNVTDMRYMFYYARNARPDVAKWNVSKVTNMESMFYYAQKSCPMVRDWDVSKVVKMKWMFFYVRGCTDVLDASNWNLESAVDINQMFAYSSGEPKITNWKNLKNDIDVFQLYQAVYNNKTLDLTPFSHLPQNKIKAIENRKIVNNPHVIYKTMGGESLANQEMLILPSNKTTIIYEYETNKYVAEFKATQFPEDVLDKLQDDVKYLVTTVIYDSYYQARIDNYEYLSPAQKNLIKADTNKNNYNEKYAEANSLNESMKNLDNAINKKEAYAITEEKLNEIPEPLKEEYNSLIAEANLIKNEDAQTTTNTKEVVDSKLEEISTVLNKINNVFNLDNLSPAQKAKYGKELKETKTIEEFNSKLNEVNELNNKMAELIDLINNKDTVNESSAPQILKDLYNNQISELESIRTEEGDTTDNDISTVNSKIEEVKETIEKMKMFLNEDIFTNLSEGQKDSLRKKLGPIYDDLDTINKLYEEAKELDGLMYKLRQIVANSGDYQITDEELKNPGISEKYNKLIEEANMIINEPTLSPGQYTLNGIEKVSEKIKEMEKILKSIRNKVNLYDAKYDLILSQLSKVDTSIIDRTNDKYFIDLKTGIDFNIRNILENKIDLSNMLNSVQIGTNHNISKYVKMGVFFEYNNDYLDSYSIGISNHIEKSNNVLKSIVRYRALTDYSNILNHNIDAYIKYGYGTTNDNFSISGNIGFLTNYSFKTKIENNIELDDVFRFRFDFSTILKYDFLSIEPVFSIRTSTKQFLRETDVYFNERLVEDKSLEKYDFKVKIELDKEVSKNVSLRANLEGGLNKYLKFGLGIGINR